MRNEAEIEASVSAISEAGLSWVRIGCDWSLREPEKDNYYWEPLEARLQAFHDAGISVLLSIETHQWPDWTAADDPEHDDPQTLDEFRAFVGDLLSAYGGMIQRIQLGNEWNWEIDDYFSGSEAAFISYTNIVSEEVRSYRSAGSLDSPSIVLGSFSGGRALAYDQGLISEIVLRD